MDYNSDNKERKVPTTAQESTRHKRQIIKRRHPLEGQMLCGKIKVDSSRFPPIAKPDQHSKQALSEVPEQCACSRYQVRTQHTMQPDCSTTYTPADFYRSFDKPLANRIKRFLANPPYNSDEYFERLARPEKVVLEFESRDIFEQSFIASEGDVPSESMRMVLPERKRIQSMVLPPIHENCTENFSDRYSKHRESLFEEDLDEFEKLRYCTYLRDRRLKHSHGAGYKTNDIRKHLHSR